MNTTLTSNKLNWNVTFVVLFFASLVSAQSEPFNCDYNAYLFQYNDVYAIDLASGSSYEVAT